MVDISDLPTSRNLVELFQNRADAKGAVPFLWAKRGGAWHSISWADAARQVCELAEALRGLGLETGDRVMLVSENRPEWCIADFAIMAASVVLLYWLVSATPLALFLLAAFATAREVARAINKAKGDGTAHALDGRVVRVCARPEALLHVTCANAFELTRAAYHLGNRHVALQLGDGWLRLPDDYVLKAMLEQLGATVELIEAPYQPEQGAYGGGHHHSHAGDAEFSYAPRLHQFGARK